MWNVVAGYTNFPTMVMRMEAEQQATETIAIDADGAVTLPVVEVLTGRAFLTGKSGAGKSNSASVVAEELLDRGFPLMIVDTDGEYWGLKEQYEILHVGADDECDLQVSAEHAVKLAELALEDNVPIILDVSGYLEREDANALVRETTRELFQREKKLKKPFLLLVEEIHEYIPEGGGLDETGKMLIRVAKRGRKRGLGLAGMSQRPADVKKDFITQCDWLLWHRLTWENDTQVVRRVVGQDYADAVQELGDGEAFLMADFMEEDVQRVQVRRKRTFDAGATPDLDDFERPDLKSVSGDLVDELAEISAREERRQDRVAQLEQRIEVLEAEKAELEEELAGARDIQNLAQQMAEGLQQAGDGDVVGEKVDELVSERNQLQSTLEQREEQIEQLHDRVQELEGELEQRPAIGDRTVEAVEVLATEFGVGGDDETLRRKLKSARERIEELEDQRHEPPKTDILDHPAVQRQLKNLKKMVDDLNEKELKMMEWFKFYGPGELGDAYFHAGYKRSSGRKRDASKRIRNRGLVEKVGKGSYDYALDDVVRGEFEDNPQISESDIEALIAEVEARFDERVENVD